MLLLLAARKRPFLPALRLLNRYFARANLGHLHRKGYRTRTPVQALSRPRLNSSTASSTPTRPLRLLRVTLVRQQQQQQQLTSSSSPGRRR